MATDIVPVAETHFQLLIVHPWIEAALFGAFIGIAGASLYIGASCFFRTISDRRRSRHALALFVRFNAEQPSTEHNVIGQGQISVPSGLKEKPEATQSGVDPRPSR
jgi:hypothetical protein